MDCSPPGSSVHGDSPGKNNGIELPCPPPRDLPNPVIKPRSPALQADSLPSEPPGRPMNTGVGSLSLLQGLFPIRNWTGISCIAGGFFTCWDTRETNIMFTECEFSDGERRGGSEYSVRRPGMRGRIILFCRQWLTVCRFRVSGSCI